MHTNVGGVPEIRGAACLELAGISLSFGGLTVVDNVSFVLAEGEILGLVGPNGAGKTSLLNIVSGVLAPQSGKVFSFGRDITGWPSHRVANAGITRTFQNMRLFLEMTALENVMVGRHAAQSTNLFSAIFRQRKEKEEERDVQDRAMALLAKVGLEDRAGVWVDEMSYGQQRRVELARALALEPRLLLLDEPTAGLPASEIDRLYEVLNEIRDSGCSILLIEHNMKFVSRQCDRLIVLNFGSKIDEGIPDEVLRSSRVKDAYLGEEPA